MPEIKVDKEFQSLIPPLSQEEYTQLEANIVSDGCRDALVIWNGVLIDGHNRHKICTEHNIPFQTIEKQFDSRNDAIQWIILNQFGRRNLSPGTRSILALRLEPILAEKAKERQKEHGGTAPGKSLVPKSAPVIEPIKTRDGLAKIAGVGHDTIDKVKQIVSRGTPEQVERIKKGDKGNTVNAVYQEVRAKDVPKPIPAKDPEKEPTIQEIVQTLKDPDASPEFTIDMLVEELSVNADEYVHALKNSIVTRSTLLSTPENREKVIKELNNIKAKIERLKEIIK